MLVEITDARGHHLQPSLQLVPIQVDKESTMSQVIGRNCSKQMTVVVVLVVPMNCSPV